MALINTEELYSLAEEVRKNARAEIASLQYSRNRLLYSNNLKDKMTIDTYNSQINAFKQYEKIAKPIVKAKKRIEKTTDDPNERQRLLEEYVDSNVKLGTLRTLKFASENISSEQKTKLNVDYFKSPTNNTGTNASNKHVTFDFDFNNTYHETYPTVNSFVNNSEISADDNESFVDSVIDNQFVDENFRDDDNISLYNYDVDNQDEGDNLHDSVDDIQVAGENLEENNLGESSFEDYPYDNESLVEGFTDNNESSINDVQENNVQEYYDRTSITPTKDDPEWDKLWDEKIKQISKIKPHINELTSRYNNLIEKEEQHKKKNNYFTDRNKKTASEKFNTYYKTLISSDHVNPVDEKYLNSQINAAYSVIGHDYYQPKKNSKWSSLLSGAKQKSNESITPQNTSYTISSERLSNLKPARKLTKEKVVVNPNNTGANQGITIPERTTSRNHGMTPRINRH
ncbi:hypothetical protein [Pseudobutyrivibrio sp.]|jgi:hypothetical protein|uniref:hypothetical protein n=1 Tax=Pseudobutyrivibrio sp. TaxID=2014367 RepID=UPI0025EA3675|nr:hypothetical protein [Pseudobutyrivibrio sp.]